MLLQIENLERMLRMQSELCKILANPARLRLLHQLREGEKTVSELSLAAGLRQANVSQHLALMRHRKVVVERRVGNAVFYSVTDKRIINACDLIQAVLLDQANEDSKLVKLSRRG
jgi:DNA-binding transcriptional ArsR family regulator